MIRIVPYKLHFRQAAGTSRGVLHSKESWFVLINKEGNTGIGECSLIPGLSIDNRQLIEKEFDWLESNPEAVETWKQTNGKYFPALQFALETALSDLKNNGQRIFGESPFTKGEKGIPINGLIWMGTPAVMKKQISEKLETGFNCIKIKIGAIEFEEELQLLRLIREEYDAATIEIRVDANGAFAVPEAEEKLKKLSAFDIHSIEQPVKAGQWEAMAALCEKSPVPIALDEELIGITDEKEQTKLLETIKPRYIILKPSLLGGLAASEIWIKLANERQTGWWATSALESNIGLNAIAQWAFKQNNPMPQGLGTGQLYTNNIDAPLVIRSGHLFHEPQLPWKLDQLLP